MSPSRRASICTTHSTTCWHRLSQAIWVGALTPGQRGVEAKAPVQLIYVVDVHRLTHTAGFQEPGLQDPEVQKSYYYVDTGLIAGNVYLFAAAEGRRGK